MSSQWTAGASPNDPVSLQLTLACPPCSPKVAASHSNIVTRLVPCWSLVCTASHVTRLWEVEWRRCQEAGPLSFGVQAVLSWVFRRKKCSRLTLTFEKFSVYSGLQCFSIWADLVPVFSSWTAFWQSTMLDLNWIPKGALSPTSTWHFFFIHLTELTDGKTVAYFVKVFQLKVTGWRVNVRASGTTFISVYILRRHANQQCCGTSWEMEWTKKLHFL